MRVTIKENEKEYCEFCAIENKQVESTHFVEIVHDYRWIGVISRFTGVCLEHAKEIKAEIQKGLVCR